MLGESGRQWLGRRVIKYGTPTTRAGGVGRLLKQQSDQQDSEASCRRTAVERSYFNACKERRPLYKPESQRIR